MLVCNVSLRPPARIIAAVLAEAAAAADVVTRSSGIAALLDEPASASDTLNAFVGQIIVEAASASDAVDAGLFYAVLIDEPASAADLSDAIGGAAAESITEAASADSVQDATVISAARAAMIDGAFVNYSTPRQANVNGVMVNV